MVPCETSDLEVPANAEIVLEGYVEVGELRLHLLCTRQDVRILVNGPWPPYSFAAIGSE